MFHKPFTRACREQYGGGWHHLKMLWWFKYRMALDARLGRWFRCPFGKHNESLWFEGDQVGVDCWRNCGWSRLPSEAELERNRPIRIDSDTEIVLPDWMKDAKGFPGTTPLP